MRGASAAAAATSRSGNRAPCCGAAARGVAGAAWQPDITVITTRGDVDQSPYLAGSVEKGFFTKELEVALLDRRIDLVVHSLKDLPTAEPAGLTNRTILPRASAGGLAADPARIPRSRAAMGSCRSRRGARIGASSLRRGALIGRFAPQASLGAAARQRADAGAQARRRQTSVDAIVLAGAGLSRLQLDLSAFRRHRTRARVVGAGAGAGRARRAMPRG